MSTDFVMVQDLAECMHKTGDVCATKQDKEIAVQQLTNLLEVQLLLHAGYGQRMQPCNFLVIKNHVHFPYDICLVCGWRSPPAWIDLAIVSKLESKRSYSIWACDTSSCPAHPLFTPFDWQHHMQKQHQRRNRCKGEGTHAMTQQQ